MNIFNYVVIFFVQMLYHGICGKLFALDDVVLLPYFGWYPVRF